MARIKKWAGGYIDPASGAYFIRRTVAGEHIHFSTRCKTEEGALAELARWEANPSTYVSGQAQGALGQPILKLDKAVEKFLEYSEHVKGNGRKHVSAQASYADNWFKFWDEYGVTEITQVDGAMVDTYIAWRRKGGAFGEPVGPHSIALDVAFIKVLMAWASRRDGGFLPLNPLHNYAIPKRPKGGGKVRAFDLAWWEAVKPHIESTVLKLAGDVLLGSSIRWSSLHRLQREDIDEKNNVIRLRGNAIKGKEGTTIYASERVVRAALSIVGLVPACSSSMNHALVRACKKAGVDYHSVHDFRHTAASMAIDDGLAGVELQRRLAHANFATTERYIHQLGKGSGYRGRI